MALPHSTDFALPRTDPTTRSTPSTTRHEQAEALLARLETCRDQHQRRRLQEEVVMLTLDLADGVAYRYRGRGIETEDLVQVARLALVKAVQGYRTGRGNSFAGYAAPTISGEIKRHFRDYGWAIRPPRRLQELRSRLAREEEQLRHDLGREPEVAELAAALGVQNRDIEAARESADSYHTLSLDLAMTDGAPVQVAGDGDAFTDLAEHDALVHALRDLPERDRLIVSLRFGQEMTQSEIGRELGVSQMQVSRLLGSLLARLRTSLTLAEEGDDLDPARTAPGGRAGVRAAHP